MAILDQNGLPSTLVPQAQGQPSPFAPTGSPLPQGLTPEQAEELKKYLAMQKPSAFIGQGGKRISASTPPGVMPASHLNTLATSFKRPSLQRGREHEKDSALAVAHNDEPIGTLQFPDGNSIAVTKNNSKEVYALARRVYPQMFGKQEVDLPGATEKGLADVKAHPEKYKGSQYKTDFEKDRPGANRPGGGDLGSLWDTTKGLLSGLSIDKEKFGQLPLQQVVDRAAGLASDVATRQVEGHGLPYQVGAASAEGILGANVKGMEEAARRGDPGGVRGSFAGSVLPVVAMEALHYGAEPAGKLATKGLDKFADVGAERAAKVRAEIEAKSPTGTRTLPDVLDGLIKGAKKRAAPAATAATAHALGLPKLAMATEAVWGTFEAVNGLLKTTPGMKMRLAMWDAIKDWHSALPEESSRLTPQQQSVVDATKAQKESGPEYTVSNATEQRLREAQEKGNRPFTPREKPPTEPPPSGGSPTPPTTPPSPTSSKGVTIKSTTSESPTTESPSATAINPDASFMRQDSLNRAHEILSDAKSSPESKKWSVNVLRDEVDRLGKEANNPKLSNKEFVSIIQQISDLEERLGKSMGKVVSEPIKTKAQLSQEKFTADLKKKVKLADFGIKGDQIPPDLEKLISDQVSSMQKKGTFVGVDDLLKQVQSKWIYRQSLGGVEPFEARLKAAKATKDPLARTTAINNALNFEKQMLETRFGDEAGQIARAALEKSKLDPMHQLAVIRKWIREGSSQTGLKTRGPRPEGPKEPGSGPGAMRARPIEGPPTPAEVAEFNALREKLVTNRTKVRDVTNEERDRYRELYRRVNGPDARPEPMTNQEGNQLDDFLKGISPLPQGGK